MTLRTGSARGILLGASALAALSLWTLPARNDFFEFCTTKAYGFPLPWWVTWCECEKGSRWPAQLFFWSANLLLALAIAAVVSWLFGRYATRSDRVPRAPSM